MAPDLTADPFAPPPGGWVRVSPRLAFVRRAIGLAIVLPIGLLATVLFAINDLSVWAGISLLVMLVVAVWIIWIVGRQVRAIGYCERADDLVVTRGVMFRELVIVPYGRMQLVDVRGGPLARRYGMSTLQLHTAAATTDAAIPGLPVAEAGRLRDRLAALGEARTAGL